MIRVFRWFSFESFTLVDPNNNCCSSRSLRFFGRIIAFCKGDFRFGFLLWTLYSVFHSAPAEGPLLAFAMKLFFFRRTAHLVRYPSGITAGTWSSLCVFAGFAVRSAHGARLFLQSCGSGLSYAFHSTGVAGSFGPHAYRTPYTMVSIKKKIHIFGRDRTPP